MKVDIVPKNTAVDAFTKVYDYSPGSINLVAIEVINLLHMSEGSNPDSPMCGVNSLLLRLANVTDNDGDFDLIVDALEVEINEYTSRQVSLFLGPKDVNGYRNLDITVDGADEKLRTQVNIGKSHAKILKPSFVTE